jgi:hypothetical protein
MRNGKFDSTGVLNGFELRQELRREALPLPDASQARLSILYILFTFFLISREDGAIQIKALLVSQDSASSP